MIAFIFITTAFYATTWNGILTGYTVECMSYDVRSKLIVTQNFTVQAAITVSGNPQGWIAGDMSRRDGFRLRRRPHARCSSETSFSFRHIDLSAHVLTRFGHRASTISIQWL